MIAPCGYITFNNQSLLNLDRKRTTITIFAKIIWIKREDHPWNFCILSLYGNKISFAHQGILRFREFLIKNIFFSKWRDICQLFPSINITIILNKRVKFQIYCEFLNIVVIVAVIICRAFCNIFENVWKYFTT